MTPAILVDQVGYPGAGRAYVLADAVLPAGAITLTRAGAPVPFVLRVMREPDTGRHSHEVTWTAADGLLELAVAGGPSRAIRVDPAAHDALLVAALRTYYLQRCGVEIVDPVGGRPACHLGDGLRAHADAAGPADERIPATGGWHDAGDYGKYVATTATVALELLTRYERYPALVGGLSFGIPRAGVPAGMPDLLAEVAVGLDWMLAMQRGDGAIYRKVGGRAWPPLIPPEGDTPPRYLYGPTTPETAKSAAAWALAARVYRAHDAPRADRYLDAARAAWAWLQEQPDQLFDMREGDNSGSGPYMWDANDPQESLKTDAEDRLAAAIELFLTTRDPHCEALVDRLLPRYRWELFEWKDVASGSATSLLWHPDARKGWRKLASAGLLARAREGLARAAAHPYGMANRHLVWGSNKMTVEEGVFLLAAHRVAPDPALVGYAWQQLHLVLGANPLDRSFVTGFGDNPVRDPSHIFLRAVGRVIPGLLVGGPNIKEQSGIGPKDRGFLSYADDGRSYATNENAIDYNSALIALIIDLKAVETKPYPGR